jgi:hypothetical protein
MSSCNRINQIIGKDKIVLLLKYNKPTNAAFDRLSQNCTFKCIWDDLSVFDHRIDTLPYGVVDKILSKHSFDWAVVGDIFWTTGQHICLWCKKNNKNLLFLQHGQWIYTENKKNPKHVPSHTGVFGRRTAEMVKSWPYAQRSKVIITGTPRYENCVVNPSGDFVYFAPPVIGEKVPTIGCDKISSMTARWIESLRTLDQHCKLKIHPHYRELKIDFLKQMFPQADILPVDDDPLDFIQQSCAVLTHRNSTTVLDAIACGKPVILMNFEKFDHSFYPKNYFLCKNKSFAHECNDLNECIMALISPAIMDCSHEEYRHRAYNYIYL